MKPFHKGLLLAAIHLAMVLSLGAKLLIDRATLPRVWVRIAPYNPLPPRGRYVNFRLQIDSVRPPDLALLEGRPAAATLGVAFFVPEHVPDPSFRPPGEELGMEVTIPKKGLLRPIRLGVKKDGVLTPLDLTSP